VVADVINGATVRVVSDQGSWTSSPVAFDASSAAYSNPATSTIRLTADGGIAYIGAEVPASCSVNNPINVITEPPRIEVGQISCGVAAAREFVNYPFLNSVPLVEEPGHTVYRARYAAAYGEIYAGNTQVKFDWWINRTSNPVLVQHEWHSGWLTLSQVGNVKYAIPDPENPPNWIVTCPGVDYKATVTITTNDGWSVKDTWTEPRECLPI
jgi:hypothetical protein